MLFGMTLLALGALYVPWSEAAGYSQPPKAIRDVMRAETPPQPNVSPTHDRMLLVSWQESASITKVAMPYLRLPGVRIEPKNHSKYDTPGGNGIAPCVRSSVLDAIAEGARTPITQPAGACPNRPVWSANGKRCAFENVADTSVELGWVMQ